MWSLGGRRPSSRNGSSLYIQQPLRSGPVTQENDARSAANSQPYMALKDSSIAISGSVRLSVALDATAVCRRLSPGWSTWRSRSWWAPRTRGSSRRGAPSITPTGSLTGGSGGGWRSVPTPKVADHRWNRVDLLGVDLGRGKYPFKDSALLTTAFRCDVYELVTCGRSYRSADADECPLFTRSFSVHN